jgi:hypothetical protein
MMRVTGVLYSLLIILILIGMGGLLASCQPAVETEVAAQAEGLCNLPIPETETMNTSENETMALKEYGIPPIDAAAPDRTMTATFSLG